LGGTVQNIILDPKKDYFFFVGLFMSINIEQLEQEVQNIKARNVRVEKEKTWETSWQRKI
jgi:hypothetical protein